MANPTGTDFLASVALNTDPITGSPYVWADGDVYELPQTDEAEGAALGATFNGLGVFNQPASKLLNKINLVRAAQLTDETNIGVLQTFDALFSGSVSNLVGGYIKIPFLDVSLGASVLIAQWGFYPWAGLTASAVENALFTFGFPVSFPTSCQFMLASLTTNDTTSGGGLVQCALNLEPVRPFGKTQGQVFSDWNNQSGSVITVATALPGSIGLLGFQWLAIGY